MDRESHDNFLALLAPVCRYFAYYATQEFCRHLDIRGGEQHTSRRARFGNNVLIEVHPIQALRTSVEECMVSNRHHDSDPSRLSRLLPSLDNLEILILSDTSICYFLLQTISRLCSLKELVLDGCHMKYHSEPIFENHEAPYASLRRLIIKGKGNYETGFALSEALCALCSATSLRSVAILDSDWLLPLLPHISEHIVAFSGDFSYTSLTDFYQFIKARPSLQDLTLCSDPRRPLLEDLRNDMDSLPLTLDKEDLPELRSFNGPDSLAPIFIRGRPVTRLALGFPFEPPKQNPSPSPSSHGLTVFSQTNFTTYPLDVPYSDSDWDVWDNLKTIGGGIQELFVRSSLTSPSVIALCFPNLIHLQVEPWHWNNVSCSYKTDGLSLY